MKFAAPLVIASLLTWGLFAAPHVATAQAPAPNGENFPGVKKALTPEQYASSGLDKLTPEERAKLDDYLKGYFTGATQQVVQQAVAKASSQAVDQAVKQHRVDPPTLIESRILGEVNGWKSDQIFVLENGQHWKITDDSVRHFPAVTDPQVYIVKDFVSYKMAIVGGGVARVSRLR